MALEQHAEQALARRVLGRDFQNAATHGDCLLRATLIAIRECDRAIQLHRFETPSSFAHETRDLDAKPEIVRLVFEPLLGVF